jgi:AcrR family transcriptional regulator
MWSNSELTRTQQVRRADILAAAIRLIAESGFAAGSVVEVARSAETSKGTVLYHFGSKAALNEAIVESLFQSGRDYMRDALEGVASPRDRFRIYLTSNLRFIADHAAHVIAVHRILENTVAPNPAPDAVAELAALLLRGQQEGEFAAFDPFVASVMVRTIIDGASFHLTEAAVDDVDRQISEVVALLERAIGSEKP